MSERLSLLEQEALVLKGLAALRPLMDWDPGYCSDDVRTLLRSIHRHLFDETLNVDWLEQTSGLFRAETKEHFKRCTKFRVHEYIENRRAQAAMWLLWENDLDISTIGYGVGYANYRTFARAFERQAGCSPLQYRARWSKRRARGVD